MANDVMFLDIHKVAAIIIYSVIKTEVLESDSNNSDDIYLHNYELAISAGLSFMQYELNEELYTQKKKPISKLCFPDAIYSKKII